MHPDLIIKRTTTADAHFQLLVAHLDNELWNELKEDQATYDPFNKVPDINTAVVAYWDQVPVACGCFKPYDAATVEVKRMFVEKTSRGKGISKRILEALEQWAIEKNYRFAILETSINFKVATGLYISSGYEIIPNYPPYIGLAESVCMRKQLDGASG
jgi:putative acetyltransferase